MTRYLLTLLFTLMLSVSASATPAWGIELHDRLAPDSGSNAIAITLDACGGAFDAELVGTLVKLKVPATVFVTKKWLDRNPVGTAMLLAHPDLFELEDHGTAHIPAVIGIDRRVYGLAAEPDVAHLDAEVLGAAQAIRSLTGNAPRFFRGATAIYDHASIERIQAMGYIVAGFSVNADAGATLPRKEIVARLRAIRPGDIVIAHVNKPGGATAEAFATALPELLGRGYRFVTLYGARLQPQ